MSKAVTILCPLCNDQVDKLLYRYHFDNERAVLEKIKANNPDWTVNDGACSRCVDYYHTELVMQQRILPEIGPHFPIKSADDFIILPTGLRLNADPRYTGKGVTICFIDSGFYPHLDLTAHKNRIKLILDIPNNRVLKVSPPTGGGDLEGAAWHGTMTSVVCAGDGYLSKGLYKGIASDAELVLLKVSEVPSLGGDLGEARIRSENIVKALQWVLQHHREYDIRVVNISLGNDEAVSYKQSPVDLLAEQLIEEGIVVVAAAGNDENGMIKAPANSPNVITVGGTDDDNQLAVPAGKLYHSTFGKTADDIMKPELVAPAIWIAAPILPETREQREAEALHCILQTGDLYTAFEKFSGDIQINPAILQSGDAGLIKDSVLQRIQTCRYISPHYMHVDGTSFAAPIVSSIIAQLLETDPTLTPAMIRHLLFSTAKRINNFPAERQGFGTVQPKKAILKIVNKPLMIKPEISPLINSRQKTIGFYVQHECASQISLAGSFNHWEHDVLLLEPGTNGVWKIEIPMLPAGRYLYKFFVDDRSWMEDINNPYREPDGFSGFNSILIVDNQ
ncbi:S8 family serine peptidase [Terrimonas pollutisoli]|uniref:S8 family serine peptidase n=1 Tax=Terrimonas pollutisoli TaxID=3034147 RepID=UPI0023EB21CB|nr:S8 family serine peptidase [Terrimonas sp. H1YJ31]